MSIKSIVVVGLGYVGLPLALSFARAGFYVYGVDVNEERVNVLRAGGNPSPDLPDELFPYPKNMDVSSIVPPGADMYAICVPTPVAQPSKTPAHEIDMEPVLSACFSIGSVIGDDAIVVVESTVTPGMTNGVIRDAIAAAKGDDKFYVAFSPERVNPGDGYFYKYARDIKLIGADDACSGLLVEAYGRVFEGTEVVGIEEAELAKVFENAQRDVNIALMNELSIHCHLNNLNYSDVIKGLRTKPSSPVFRSGIVGGHCIPVDPYFLVEYYGGTDNLPFLGRWVNERYAEYISTVVCALAGNNDRVLIVGRSYKPSVSDTRNAGGAFLLSRLRGYGLDVEIHDPLIDGPYVRDLRPTIVVGLVNHMPAVSPYAYYRCDPGAAFVNVGEAFSADLLSNFANVVEL